MPTLADIANFVDSTKRRLSLLAKDPVVFWEMLNSEARDANRTAVDRGNALASAMPQVRDQAIQQMMADPAATATNWMGGGLMNHIVYHGSPHKFDKFDASKIGTGEGAQAYGHGLYLADKPGVATGYKTAGVDKSGLADDMKKVANAFYEALEPLSDGSVLFKGAMLSKDKFLRYFEEGKITTGDFSGPMRNKVEKALMPSGNLYTVDLPDEWLPKMLDWDKPLSQQPEAVRKALKTNGSIASSDEPLGMALQRAQRNRYNAADLFQGGVGELGPLSAQEISDRLAQQGIPGIRYLDGGSRGMQILSPAETVNKEWVVKQVPNGNVIYRGMSEQDAKAAYNTGVTANYVVFPGMEQFLKILKME